MILLELARFVEEKNRAMCHEIPDFCARVLAILANQAGISNSPFARPVRVGHDRVMATATRTQRRYDHRLRNLVRTTRDIHCAVQRGVPRSTARGWLTDSEVPVVTVEALNLDAIQLQREAVQLG